MLHFPFTYAISIVNCWLKIMPNPNLPKNDEENYSKEEAEEIMAIKYAVKEFVHTLIGHLKALHDYLKGVI